MFRSCIALLVAALALTGCAAAAHTPRTAAATPTLPCTLPYGTRVALVSPKPGSAKVSPGSTTVVVAASRDLPKTTAVVATDAKGDVADAALERSTRKTHPPAPFPHAVYYRAKGVSLAPHGSYTVALDDLAQNGCAPYVVLEGNPRFST